MKLTVAQKKKYQERYSGAKVGFISMLVCLALFIATMLLLISQDADQLVAVCCIGGVFASFFLFTVFLCGHEMYRCRKILRRDWL